MKPLRVPADLGEAVAGGHVRLDDDALRFVTRVHRRGSGAPLALFDPERALEADGVLEGDGARVVAPRPAERAARPAVLLQALAKGEKIDAVVRDATELGAAELRVFRAARSVAEASAARRARWDRVAVQAARQCGRADRVLVPFAASLEDAARDLPAGALAVLLDPGAPVGLGALLRGPPAPAALVAAVGPEGGFDDAERALLARLGFAPARLGRWVHRTETAAAAILGAWLAAEP